MAKICVDINKVYGWGQNNYGELGAGNVATFNSITELQHNDIDKVFVNVNLSTGYLKNNGDLWMSGWNSIGQFGIGNVVVRSSPIQIPGKFICISGNSMADQVNLFLKQDNTLWASGCNRFGQLGQSNIINQSSMVQIPGNWISIGNGIFNSFGIKSDCTLWAWGYNAFGQLGDITITNKSSPIQIPGTWICATATSNGYTSFGIKTNCTLWVWGRNDCGQFGLSCSINFTSSSPIQIPGTWIGISAGSVHVVGIKSDCTLWAWGQNSDGELGDITVNSRSFPIQIPGTWISAKAGYSQTIGLKSDCTLWSWGTTPNGVTPTRGISSPVQIPGNYTYVSTGCRNSIAMYKLSKEYNKNYNKGPFTLNETYICSRGDNWTDFIPTIDD